MRHFLRSLALFAALACAWQSAAAQQELAHPARGKVILAQRDQGSAPRITLSEATEIVRRSTGGRVLNAQESRRDGREGYRVKVLIGSGEVRVFFVDARSGSMQQD